MRSIVKRAVVALGIALGLSACGGSRTEEWSRSTTAASAEGSAHEPTASSGVASGAGGLAPRQPLFDAGGPPMPTPPTPGPSDAGTPGFGLSDAGSPFAPPVLGVDGGVLGPGPF